MDKKFWDERYAMNEFVYGIEPNDFLKENAHLIKGRVLCLAEGEGRNGVYLSKLGNTVHCIDYSDEAIQKMNELAEKNKVDITTQCMDLTELNLTENSWDAIVCIFGHFPEKLRKHVHSQVYKALKPNGVLIIEAYSKGQIHRDSGGPRSEMLLYSNEELHNDFREFQDLQISEKVRLVNEGIFHNGLADVVQVIARK